MLFLTVKNWKKYQHYKCTNPQWIKLHCSLLDDYAFRRLPDVEKFTLLFLWLYAARYRNRIPFDEKWIKEHLGNRKVHRINKLIDLGWLILVDDNGTEIATCERARRERRRAQASPTQAPALEKEKEKEKDCGPPLRGVGELHTPIISWSTRNIPVDVIEALLCLPACKDSEIFKHSVGHLLRNLGFDVKYEFPVNLDQNGRKGRLDIVACRENEILAIECDRVTDRRKSIRNLKCFGQPGIILLREPNVASIKATKRKGKNDE